MSFRADLRASVYALVESAVPGIKTQADAIETNRRSIQSLFVQFMQWKQDGGTGPVVGMEPPLMVYDWGRDAPYEGTRVTSQITRLWHIEMFYVTSLAYPSAKDVEDYMSELETAADAILKALRAQQTGFQLVTDVVTDFGSTNAANAMFQAFNLPYVAVSIAFDMRYSVSGL